MSSATNFILNLRRVALPSVADHVLLFASYPPNPRQMLAELSKEAGNRIWFYALTSQDTTLEVFLRQWVAALHMDEPAFGKHILTALTPSAKAPTLLAQALIRDLQDVHPESLVIFLDDFDRLPPSEETAIFFTECLSHLPTGVRWVLNGRGLAQHAWLRGIHVGEVAVVGALPTLDNSTDAIADEPVLEVYGFGDGRAFIDGRLAEGWEGPLVERLFFYFVDHPMTSRDNIFEVFWPEVPVREATNVFHVTKRKITEVLGHELTQYAGLCYTHSPNIQVRYDVARFEGLIEQARSLPRDEALPLWQQAIRLYRFPFLQHQEATWIQERRAALQLLYVEALVEVGRGYAARNDPDRAISFFLRALREVPTREDLHRDVMRLYQETGEVDKAVRQYKTLEDVLERTLSITPCRATRELYQALIAEPDLHVVALGPARKKRA